LTLLLLLATSLCVIGLVLGWQFPRVRWVGVIAGSVVLYLVSLMAWWWALYFQVVPMDRILAPFTHPTRNVLDGPLFLVPPLLPPAVFLLFLALRRR
jgi:uncharacterized membrane protein YqjE